MLIKRFQCVPSTWARQLSTWERCSRHRAKVGSLYEKSLWAEFWNKWYFTGSRWSWKI